MSNLIDIHTHYVPNGWPDLTEDAGSQAPWLKSKSTRRRRHASA